jgi:putative AdoMet-dependent methyltransferase
MSSPIWFYDELNQIGTDYNSVQEVEEYDARMKKLRDISSEIEAIIKDTRLGSGQSVIDIGCGTGEFVIAAAQRCKLVYGLDISSTMLEYAKRKIQKLGLANIKLIKGGFLTYNHQDEPVDLVVSQLALHHLPDLWKAVALKRVYSMLKPCGRFFLRDVVFPSNIKDYHNYFDSLVADIRSTGGDENARNMALHIKDEYSTLSWIMEGLLDSCGFRIEHSSCNDFIAVYLCVKDV